MASKKRGVKVPPAVRPIVMGGYAGYLFTGEDITELAKRNGIEIIEDTQILDNVAHQLHEAFDYAIGALRSQNAEASPSNMAKWFKDVEKKAADLLALLGFDTAEKTLNEYDLAFPSHLLEPGGPPKFAEGIVNFKEAVFQNGDLFPNYYFLPEQVRRATNSGDLGPAGEDIVKSRLEIPAGITPQDYFQKLTFETAFSLLDASPWIVALIAELSRRQAEFYKAQQRRGGDKKDEFTTSLFWRVYAAYQTMTGTAPKLRLRDRERDENAPAALWAKALCKLALERAPGVFRPLSENELLSIRKLTELSNTTIVNHLEAGGKNRNLANRKALPKV